ncbi:MAG: DUF4344 domain-containing metallopeptidase [Acidobacteria bacterium]|nr:DUF4344 domain-containing metallopeptidase [Acidobacteriota bacterium]
MKILKNLYSNSGILAFILTIFAVLGCSIGFGDQKPDKPASPATDKRSSALSTDDASAIKKATTTSKKSNAASENSDNGDFVPVYAELQNEKYAAFNERFKQQKVVEGITDALNQSFALPADVQITFRDCGVANAWYQPQTKTITFCYEFMELFYTKAIEMGKSEDEANRIMIGATLFFFFHELGHCLVDVYELPATGREEDAVDQLSMLILMETMDEDGQYSAASGAIIFKALAENEEASERTFSNEHSLSSQRFYNLVCWMYGKDPNQFGSLVTDGTLPEQRAGRCPDEYQKMSKAWEKLITPWIKK